MNGTEIALPAPFRAVSHDRLPSTNDEAKAVSRAGATHGTVIWAREQSAGRGRVGRTWESPAGNLYMSVVLRPAVPPYRAAEAGFVAGLAVLGFVRSAVPDGVEVSLKWPNDVLVGGAKVAGILLETEGAPQLDWIVAGIGLNLTSAPTGTPYPAACLRDCGGTAVAPERALREICGHLARGLEEWERRGFPAVRSRWLASAHGRGDTVSVRHNGGVISGVFSDIDEDGTLILDTPDGPCRLSAGDVHFPAP